jgi:hypothetical protein
MGDWSGRYLFWLSIWDNHDYRDTIIFKFTSNCALKGCFHDVILVAVNTDCNYWSPRKIVVIILNYPAKMLLLTFVNYLSLIFRHPTYFIVGSYHFYQFHPMTIKPVLTLEPGVFELQDSCCDLLRHVTHRIAREKCIEMSNESTDHVQHCVSNPSLSWHAK